MHGSYNAIKRIASNKNVNNIYYDRSNNNSIRYHQYVLLIKQNKKQSCSQHGINGCEFNNNDHDCNSSICYYLTMTTVVATATTTTTTL